MHEITFILFWLWLAAMLVTGWSVVAAREFARRVTREFQTKPNQPTTGDCPPVAAILPIKGLDADTEQNIRALLNQDYPRFRLIFSVESATDPVIPLLDQLAHQRPGRIECVIAGLATTRGQKIHNQLAAIATTTADDAILVFIDADARPNPIWLRELVKPLTQQSAHGLTDVGATTGFRIYTPTTHTLPNIMLSIINAAVAALLGPGWRNIAWGGSMAITRENFFAFGIVDAWQNALSDDYVLSWCVKNKAQRRIQFVQACLVESHADVTWKSFWEFAARQYRITKVCTPFIWLLALAAPLLYLTAMLYTLTFWIAALLLHRPDHPLLLMFLALYLGNALRGYFLLKGSLAAVPPTSRPRLQRATFWFTLGYPLSLAINLLALLKSAPGRTITWRGVTYVMHNRLRSTVKR